MDLVFASVRRRIYMLDCFEGIDAEALMDIETPQIEILGQEAKHAQVARYSSRQNSHMVLHGIRGCIWFTEIPPAYLPLFLAGEVLHIGKNTSFGFGRYELR